ncbi:hypothetical protein [Cohnella rhizosphaerae]|uniref:RCC1 repeat-containing protein n=1 Tax=Cohnella rhizosphaerae TaxID=1457232 RepID=A0A9X4KYH8_9BACL|nr:hypothetical protein [Cohnella rhizosphaerae]MDG0810172.1 hypothetical protein [Cohnella rhizosphaerae]
MKFKSVYSDSNTTVALDSDGHIWAWGINSSGQFGDGTKTDSSIPRKIDVTDGGNARDVPGCQDGLVEFYRARY